MIILTMLAVITIPVGFLAGGVAFNAWRSGDRSMAWKAAAVFGICVAIYVAAPKVPAKDWKQFADCYIDWDGRSNPTFCR